MSKKTVIGENEIKEAESTLQRYKNGKKNLEQRIVDEELFWKQRHWEAVRSPEEKSAPVSAWMFNSIINKHADAMDSYPEAICLPREKDDEESANTLTSILPVVLRQNNFEEVYDRNWWYKLKHGCCVYGVFWDGNANGGKGEALVKRIDLLNIFWEPGVTDIQKSRNIFTIDLIPVDSLKQRYPQAKISGGDTGELTKYILDDTFDTSDKALVVDWYYKKNGRLHYCKFCEGNVLFASENEESYENGWYEDGEYPFVFDVLYPEEGTPIGFGIVSITKDPQLYIDKLDGNIMQHSHIASRPRFFAKNSAGVNEEEFLNLNKPIVHVEGSLDEASFRPITAGNIPGYMMNFRQAKIDELKETSGNSDFVQGNTGKGVTSGAAIATLQEAGNKLSRDTIKASYRAFERIINLLIERFRQFYKYEHTFRIVGANGGSEYVSFSNKEIAERPFTTVGDNKLFRKPIFDIDVKAQKQNPFSTLAQNETAMNLFSAGLLNPQMAQMAIPVLEMMTFEGKEKLLEYVRQGMTLQNQLNQMQQVNQQLMQQIAMLKGESRQDFKTGI